MKRLSSKNNSAPSAKRLGGASLLACRGRAGAGLATLLRRAAMMLLVLMTTATAWAAQSGDWTYNAGPGTCTITGYTGSTDVTTLTIPKTLDGLTVVSITSDVFTSYTKITTLNFYEDAQIEYLPNMQDHASFTTVNLINDQGTVVAENTIPASITTMDKSFRNTNIQALTMPNVTSVQDNAFQYCHGLTSVTFGKAASIGDRAFAYIRNITITYPANAEPIVEYNRTTITYPGTMANWSYINFEYSLNLVVNCSDGSLGWCGDFLEHNVGLYQNASCLHWKLNSTGDLFIDCIVKDDFFETYGTLQVIKTTNWDKSKVKTVTLNHVYDTGESTFANYTNLTTVTASSDLHTIGKEAFKGSSKLEDFYFEGTGTQWNSVTKGEDWRKGVNLGFAEHWRCTVSFDTNGHGTAPAAQTNLWSNEDVATKPTPDPSADGYVFRGWFKEAACTNLYNFGGAVVPGDMTLYAGWIDPVSVTTTAPASVEIPFGQEWTTINVKVSSLTLGNFQNTGQPVRIADHVAVTPYLGTGATSSFIFMNMSGGGNITGYKGAGEFTVGNRVSNQVNKVGDVMKLWVYIPTEVWENAAVGNYENSLPYDAVFYCNTVDPAETYDYSLGSTANVKLTLTIPEKATLSFDKNDNSASGTMDPFVMRKGINTTLPACTFTAPEGKQFICWNTKADGSGRNIANEGGIIIDKNTTLYAQWGNEYVVDLTTATEVEIPVALSAQLTQLNGYFVSDNDGMGLAFNIGGPKHIALLQELENEVMVTKVKKLAAASTLYQNYKFILKQSDEVGEYGNVTFKFTNEQNLVQMSQVIPLKNVADLNDLANGTDCFVSLYERTLKAGKWNSLCLPFNTSAQAFPEGTIIRTLSDYSNDGTTVTISFADATTMKANTPYIVHIPGTPGDDDIYNPVFMNVIINYEDPELPTNVVTVDDATFVGTYMDMGLDAVPFYLFLYDDKLYYPTSAVTINPFRGYFRLSSQLPTGGGSARILVDFGDGSVQTGIIDTDFNFASQESGISDSRDGWYTLDGRRLSGQPTQKGLYIVNGKKTVIK